MNIFLVVAVASFFFARINGIPMRCTQIAQTLIFDEYDYGNTTASSILSVYVRDNIQYVSISNVNVFDYHLNSSANRICAPDGSCTNDLKNPFEMQIGNTSFGVDAYIPGADIAMNILNVIVDEKNFYSVVDGSLYTLDNMCSTQIANQSNLIVTEVQCCMAFQPVPQAPSSPRCNKFQSRSSILNVDDNYSIFATTSMTFYLNGNSVSAEGNFSAPSNYSVAYWYNENLMCVSSDGDSNIGCYDVLLPNGDNQGLIEMEFVKWNYSADGSGSGQGYGGMLGRILIRDGQTLMEEGRPYTSKDNCFYKNFPFGGNPNQVINNQFCCKEFESAFHPKQLKSYNSKSLAHPPSLPPGFIKHSSIGRSHFPQRILKQS